MEDEPNKFPTLLALEVVVAAFIAIMLLLAFTGDNTCAKSGGTLVRTHKVYTQCDRPNSVPNRCYQVELYECHLPTR